MDNILVVDDEKNILEVVEGYLTREGYNVITASNGYDALKLIASEKISLIVLDLMLPDVSGEEICRKVRKTSDVPIIMMTAKVGEDDIISGLNMGADDYVTKPFSPRQLVARVTSAIRRSKPGGVNAKITKNDLTLDLENRILFKNDEPITLTKSEWDILALFMKRTQKIFTRDEIISIIFMDEFESFDRAIDSHIKNLRKKIEDDPKKPKYIQTVYGVGYRFGGE